MTKRVCPVPSCPNLTAGGKCTGCRRQAERERGTRQQRGYDSRHDQLRAEYQRRMDAGERFACWRCGDPINPNHWTLGHDDLDRTRYRGPECPRCQYATAGRHPA